MGQYTTPSQLSGLFKEAYGDDVMQLVPEVAKIIKVVPFVSRDKEEGNFYHQPVIVANEHGLTYAAANAGAFSLNNSISMTMQDAQIQGSQMLLRSAISYDSAAKASNSKKAFIKATELLVENMMESMAKRLEIACLYGGLGGIAQADSSVNTNATTTVITMTVASWASGIWAGLEGAQLQFYTVAGDALISTGADSIFTVSAVDDANYKVTVTGTSTGITALDSALGSGDQYVYFNGAHGSEMKGLNSIITNTTSLFNIDASVYTLWKSNTYSASNAALTLGKIVAGVSLAVQRGLNEKASVLVSPQTWSNLMTDLAAFRRLDTSYKSSKIEQGAENLTFYSQNGELEIISHNCVKKGEAFIIPMKKVKRLGAQEVSFKTPGREDEIFLHLPSNAGFELRLYTDQAIFLETPARATKITGIVNS